MRRLALFFATCVVLGASAEARGAFASSVVSYTPGNISATFQNPSAALGMPAGDTSFGVLTPFNAAFLGSHIVGIGQGGSLTMQLGATAPTGSGATLGVHAAVGLIDHDFPNGFAGPTATPYTNPRAAEVLVSDNAARWFSLGLRSFEIPTNFYSRGVTTPGFQVDPGTAVADFAKPFTRQLSDFDGRDWPGILALLDGSGGGTWVDLNSVPFGTVNFIRFDVTGAGQVMYVDAVAVVPQPPGDIGKSLIRVVPEPLTAGWLVTSGLLLRRR